MKSFILSLTAILVFVSIRAQSAEDSVKNAVNKLFTAMKTADAQMLLASFTSTAILESIRVNADGSTEVTKEDIKEFAAFIGKEQSGNADEQIKFETIKIDGPLAIVWTPYNFYYKGKFSHCGVNSFQLVRSSGIWKIQYIIDTRRKAGCGN